MASVRASIMSQARQAAARLATDAREVNAIDSPAVDQLVRCASLSEDAVHTLEWAVETLRAHSVGTADQLACQLLRAARARLDTRPAPAAPASSAGERTRRSRSLAWV